MFSATAGKAGQSDSAYGLSLIAFSLALDGATGGLQVRTVYVCVCARARVCVYAFSLALDGATPAASMYLRHIYTQILI
jgi:hypothetical protein